MMIPSNNIEEYKRLKKIIYDYSEPTDNKKEFPLGYKLKDDAPKEAKEAYKRYYELLYKEHEQCYKNWPFD
ncbi:hypothetical protein UT300013_33240 [Paraclostridium sordellii]